MIKQQQGFSLIEVLLALLILGIAMTAVFQQLTEHTYGMAVLRERLAAQIWLANYLQNEQAWQQHITAGASLVGDINGQYIWTLTVDNSMPAQGGWQPVAFSLGNQQATITSMVEYVYVRP